MSEITPSGETGAIAPDSAEVAQSQLVHIRVTADILVPPDDATATHEIVRQRASDLIAGLVGKATVSVDVEGLHAPNGESDQVSQELDSPAGEFIENLFGKNSAVTRVCNGLERDNIATLRQVLVVGRNALKDSRYLGKKSVEIITGALAHIDPQIVWYKQPTMAEIVRLCGRLTKVGVSVLGGEEARFLRGMNIQELLDTPSTVLLGQLYDAQPRTRWLESEVIALQQAAQKFADKFVEAQLQISQAD